MTTAPHSSPSSPLRWRRRPCSRPISSSETTSTRTACAWPGPCRGCTVRCRAAPCRSRTTARPGGRSVGGVWTFTQMWTCNNFISHRWGALRDILLSCSLHMIMTRGSFSLPVYICSSTRLFTPVHTCYRTPRLGMEDAQAEAQIREALMGIQQQLQRVQVRGVYLYMRPTTSQGIICRSVRTISISQSSHNEHLTLLPPPQSRSPVPLLPLERRSWSRPSRLPGPRRLASVRRPRRSSSVDDSR